MTEINAMAIQSLLEKESLVSIAWLQKELALQYREARQLADLLVKRGWLGEETSGGYKVEKNALFLRHIEKAEVGRLVDEVTTDCYLVMDLLLEHQAEGAEFKALEKTVRGSSDTREAIEILVRNKLVFVKDGRYFLCVSRKTVEAFKEMFARKRMMERRESIDRRRLMSCFDVLFA